MTGPFPPGGQPHRRSRPTRRGAYLVLAVAVALVAVVVVVGLKAVTGVFGTSSSCADASGGTAQVHVEPGDSVAQIGQQLCKAGVISSVGDFTSESSAGSIQPGYYRIHRGLSAGAAVRALLDPASKVQATIVVPEGFTAADIISRIAADTTISESSLKSALHNPQALGLPAWANGHVEGLLYPATYDVPPGSSATEVLGQMVARFKQEAATLHLAKAAAKVGLTPYQVVILASIVQAEGKLPQYLPKIAEVFYNRLHQRRPLGSNATLYYVLGHNHGPLTDTDLHLDSPYNTQFRPGLPPTPINSPGELSFRAVLHPARGNLLYFVTIDAAGHVGFAATESGYQQLADEAHRNGQQ